MKMNNENLESFEVEVGISDYPDLRVTLFLLPEEYLIDNFLKIKNKLKIQKEAHFNKKAKRDLLMLEIFFFFQKEVPPKSPRELAYLRYPNKWIKRYYVDEVEDTFFDILKQINKKEIIDKDDYGLVKNWRQKPIEEILELIDELEIKNLRRIEKKLTREKVKREFNKKSRNILIKILDGFIEEINSPEINIRINEKHPNLLENRRVLYKKICKKVWRKYYRRVHRNGLSQYLFFIKKDAEKVYEKYYIKIVKEFLSFIKNRLNTKEQKIFKLYYLPLDILGNKILYLYHAKYFNLKDFGKNVMPLLIANKVFNIKKVRRSNIEELIDRTLKAILATHYWHKLLIRENERDKKRIQRRKKAKRISIENF